MAWSPTKSILSPRAIPTNLLTYITDATRQADALTWAGGSSLKAFKTFSQSVANRTIPIFPSIAFSDDNDEQAFNGDVIDGLYSCTFEVSIQNASADTASTNARIYQKAICSMIANCPTSTLITNTGAIHAVLLGLECGFEPIKTNDMQNDFLQVFQIRASYSLTDGQYE